MAVSKAQEFELEEALEMLGSSVEVIHLVDSYGLSLSVSRCVGLGTAVSGGRSEKYGKKIGIHAHNNYSSWYLPPPQSVRDDGRLGYLIQWRQWDVAQVTVQWNCCRALKPEV